MRVICDKRTFANYFTLAAASAAQRDVKAAFQNVKLIADERNRTLVFMATNIDNSIRIELKDHKELEVLDSGELILPTSLLKEILSVCSDDRFTIETDHDNNVSFFAGRYSKIPTIPVRDFPDIETFNSDQYHVVNTSSIRRVFGRTRFSLCNDNAKYALGGVCLELNPNDSLTAISTDGRRMTVQYEHADCFGEHQSEPNTIVQLKTLEILDRIFSNCPINEVRVTVKNGTIYFWNDTILLRARLTEGRFPKWQSILPPKHNRFSVSAITGNLLQLVREAEIPKTDKQPGLTFAFQEGNLTLSARGSERGESKLNMPISYDHEPIQVKLEPRFVIEALKVLDKSQLVTLYIEKEKSVLFESEDQYSHIIMPMS